MVGKKEIFFSVFKGNKDSRLCTLSTVVHKEWPVAPLPDEIVRSTDEPPRSSLSVSLVSY